MPPPSKRSPAASLLDVICPRRHLLVQVEHETRTIGERQDLVAWLATMGLPPAGLSRAPWATIDIGLAWIRHTDPERAVREQEDLLADCGSLDMPPPGVKADMYAWQRIWDQEVEDLAASVVSSEGSYCVVWPGPLERIEAICHCRTWHLDVDWICRQQSPGRRQVVVTQKDAISDGLASE